MSHPAPGPVCRDQWSEAETDEEEEEEQVSAESGPREDEESEGGLQINVDEEEPFLLPPAGEVEQDILPEQGVGGCVCEKGFPGLPSPLPITITPGNSSLTGPHTQAPDLQCVHKRIQDIVGVLRDFGTQREEGRSRSEYLQRLRKDLATYYSYGDFLLGKLMDLFPLSEVPTHSSLMLFLRFLPVPPCKEVAGLLALCSPGGAPWPA